MKTKKTLIAAVFLAIAGWFNQAGATPPVLTSLDIGSPTVAGSTSLSGNTFTVNGSGADIWNNSDSFQFAYQTLTGDGSIIGQVNSVQNTSSGGWAKGGLMMRASLAANSQFALACSSPAGNGAANLLWRPTAGSGCSGTTYYNTPAPIWFKLVRTGNVFTVSYGTDGINWSTPSGMSQTIAMPSTIYVGLVECSNNAPVLGTSVISNVSISSANGLLTPYTWGPVVNGTVTHSTNMFNAQPIWNGLVPSAPTTGDGEAYIAAPWDQNKTVFIDLGAGWRTWRIQQTWTQYIVGRSGASPFALVWWDSTPTNTPGGTGILNTQINFGTQTNNLAGGWVQDGNFTTPITPAGRYLMLQTNGSPAANACEYAFIGYRDLSGTNYPPIASAGSNQSVQWTAHLMGTASDDGIPASPGAMTYAWTVTSAPSGGVVSFTAPNSLVTDATFTKVGTYTLQLVANDGLLSSTPSSITLTVAQSSAALTLPELKAFNYASLTLVDEILCDGVHDTSRLVESSPGVSQVQTILGRPCRVLVPTPGAPPGFFGYKMGAGLVTAGAPYILVIEYPEDKSRTTMVINRACETTRTFYTGSALGDSFTNPYVPTNASSMHFGLSQQYRSAEMLFHVHNNFPGIKLPRDEEYPRNQNASTGFMVMLAQYSSANVPMSAGAAAARIAVYAAPANWTSYAQQVTLPPNNLPKRHLFWREEMSDGELGPRGGVANDIDWYEWKAQLSKFLGMNTFSKHLLEFGYNQGFSSYPYITTTGDPMFAQPAWSSRWEQIIYRLTGGSTAAPTGYGLDFMPYFEYSGSNDGYFDGKDLGTKKLAQPLIGINGGHDYTGVTWSETSDVDVSDATSTLNPYLEGQQLLNSTMTLLAGTTGGRPVPTTQGDNRLDTYGQGTWGYIDFGTNYANYRITQAWTRSGYPTDPASPYQALYWNNSYTGFTGTSSTPAPGSIAETHINFITQPLYGRESIWKRDMNVPVSTPVIPQARYLVMHSASTLSRPAQYLLAGWINGGSTAIQTLPIPGSGPTEPGAGARHDLSNMFNNQPPFNSLPASFAGAWFRTRTSHIPMGFSDTTLLRFTNDSTANFGLNGNGGVAVTRANITPAQLTQYYSWWQLKRRNMLNNWENYIRTNINPSGVLIYTWDATEEGSHPIGANQVITDDSSAWAGLATTTDYLSTITGHMQLNSMLTPLGIYASGTGQEEHSYSLPWPDPNNYTAAANPAGGVIMSHTFNKLYTVSDPNSWSTFNTGSGIAAIRHYCLNEDAMSTQTGNAWNTNPSTSVVGYNVSDADPAGPYVMIGEARALAFGDPYYIGYLSSNSFNRCSPGYVRDFNANYLALPAMTSTTVSGAANDSEVIVRKIVTPSNGTWVAIVNTGLTEKLGVQITPPATGTVTDAVTGSTITLTSGKIVLDMWPGRLKAVRIQ